MTQKRGRTIKPTFYAIIHPQSAKISAYQTIEPSSCAITMCPSAPPISNTVIASDVVSAKQSMQHPHGAHRWIATPRKSFKARNDVCPFASPSFAPPSLRATFYQRSDPYGITTVHTMDCHASIKSFEARNVICSSKSSPSAPRHCERLHISEAIHTLNPLRLLAMRHPSAASMALIESTQAR